MEDTRRTLRLLSHQACTGGTMIAKLLGNHPDIAILSEISLAGRPVAKNFTPLSPLERLVGSYPELSIGPDFVADLVLQQLEQIHDYLRDQQLCMVVREHSHSDTFFRTSSSTRLADVWPGDVVGCLTVRYPAMSYISAIKKNWLDVSYDVYCRSYHNYLDCNSSLSLFKYEEIVCNPQQMRAAMFEALRVPEREHIPSRLERVFSGNSGRFSGQDEIQDVAVHAVSSGLAKSLSAIPSHIELCDRLAYPVSINRYCADHQQRRRGKHS